MIHDPNSKILNIVKLRAKIKSISKEGHIGVLYKRFDEILEQMLNEVVIELPEKKISTLMHESKGFASSELLTLYNTILNEEKLKVILGLREIAVLNSTDLDINDIIGGYSNIPVNSYNWKQKTEAFSSLLTMITSSNCGFPLISDQFTDFFENHGTISIPAGFPGVSGNLIRDLIKRGLISRENTEPVIDCINHIKNRVNSDTKKIRGDFLKGSISAEQFCLLKNGAYRLLQEIRYSELKQDNVDIDKTIVYWNGPGKAAFLDEWWGYDPSENKALLIAACTGVYPKGDPESWKSWVNKEVMRDRNEAESFRSIVEENRFIYNLGFILSCRESLDDFFDEIWQPVFNSFQEKNLQEKYEHISPASAYKTDAPDALKPKPEEDALTIDFEEENEDPNLEFHEDEEEDETILPETHEMIMEGAGADLDLDELMIEDKSISSDDRIIAEKSTWNRFLKPFLSENLIGVLGAGFIMLAWFTISVWVWDDKGQYSKIFVGALPMFATSLGLGWISRFFHKNLDRGVSLKAPLLFASLCILTLPFNYLFSLDMLLTGSSIGVFAGIMMALVYTGSLFMISKWTKEIFTFSPGKHLAEINGYILLPALSIIFMDMEEIHPIFADIILFVTTFAFARMLYTQKSVTKLSSRFKFSLFGGNCLLIIFIFCVYIREFPSYAAIALFMQVSAMVISYFAKSDKRINAIILSSCLSLAGILIAVSTESYMLLVCLLLSAFLWAYQRKDIQASWPDEIVASLILLLVPAFIYVSGSNWLLAGLIFIPAVFAACFYEKTIVRGELKIISFTLPVYTLLLVLYLFMFGNVNAFSISMACAAALIYGIYGFKRYEVLYQKELWLINIFLLISFPFLCAFSQTGMKKPSIAVLGVSVLLWILVSMRLRGPLTYQYRMSVHWVASFAVSILFIFYAYPPDFNLSYTLSYLAILASLLIGAKKSTSQLPVYVLIACSGLFILSGLEYLNVSFKTGTGSAASSALLLFGAYLMNRLSVWQGLSVNDRFFDKNFPLKSDKFLVYPIENTAWVLAALSFVKALSNYEFIYGSGGFSSDGVKVCLTFLILSFICIRFIKRYALKESGYLVLIPSIALYTNICSLLPLSLLPIFIVLSLFILSALIKYLEVSEDTNPEILRVLNNFMMVLSYAIIPAGFLIYVYYFNLRKGIAAYQIQIVLSVILTSVFIHMTSVKKINDKLVHFILGHITLLVSLAYLVLEKDYLQQLIDLIGNQSGVSFSFAVSSLHLILILSVVYLLPGYLIETSERRLKKAYSEAFHIWLFGTALLYSLLIVNILFMGPRGWGLPVYYFIAGIFLVHLGNRYFFFFPYVFLKAFFCLFTGLILFENQLTGIFAGMVIFSITEYLLLFMEKFPKLRFQSVKPHEKNPLWRAGWVIHGFIIMFLFTHVVYFIFQPAKIPDYLMYAMIPFGIFVFRNLGYRYTGYMAVGLFAYANCFIALRFNAFFENYELNNLHLISIAMILSILLFRGYDMTKNRIGRRAS